MIIIKQTNRGKMISLLHLSIIMFIYTSTLCQEWYMPDSHLINQEEFQQFVMNDKTTFKIVKYFSPNCGFCRYLKQVVDQLKHEKEWCFKIYDFNCAWYPQHCMTNVRSSSFPYTAIYNAQGQLHQEIHGFYPEPVIRPIFDRIQSLCREISNKQSSSEKPAVQNTNSLSSSEEEKQKQPEVRQKQELTNPVEEQQQGKEEIPVPAEEKKIQHKVQERKEEIKKEVKEEVKEKKLDEPKIELQQQQVKINKQQLKHKQEGVVHKKDQGTDYLKYIIYAITFLISIYYFHHINKGKPVDPQAKITHQNQQSIPLMQKNNEISQQQIQVQQILKEQSQLLDSIPDQSL